MPLLQTLCICLFCQLAYSIIHILQIPEVLLLLLCAASQHLHCKKKNSAALVCAELNPQPTSRLQGQPTLSALTPCGYPWADPLAWSRVKMHSTSTASAGILPHSSYSPSKSPSLLAPKSSPEIGDKGWWRSELGRSHLPSASGEKLGQENRGQSARALTILGNRPTMKMLSISHLFPTTVENNIIC